MLLRRASDSDSSGIVARATGRKQKRSYRGSFFFFFFVSVVVRVTTLFAGLREERRLVGHNCPAGGGTVKRG